MRTSESANGESTNDESPYQSAIRNPQSAIAGSHHRRDRLHRVAPGRAAAGRGHPRARDGAAAGVGALAGGARRRGRPGRSAGCRIAAAGGGRLPRRRPCGRVDGRAGAIARHGVAHQRRGHGQCPGRGRDLGRRRALHLHQQRGGLRREPRAADRRIDADAAGRPALSRQQDRRRGVGARVIAAVGDRPSGIDLWPARRRVDGRADRADQGGPAWCCWAKTRGW